MRLWSLHPRYLDAAGLVACWRETLLAQKVLAGETRGYTAHPQLVRFRAQPQPVEAIGTYLHGLADEADARGYNFDRSRVRSAPDPRIRITVTAGQVRYEWQHLLAKLAARSPAQRERWHGVDMPDAHAIFTVVPGAIEPWEVVTGRDSVGT